MKTTKTLISALSIIVSMQAFAEGGIGHGGGDVKVCFKDKEVAKVVKERLNLVRQHKSSDDPLTGYYDQIDKINLLDYSEALSDDMDPNDPKEFPKDWSAKQIFDDRMAAIHKKSSFEESLTDSITNTQYTSGYAGVEEIQDSKDHELDNDSCALVQIAVQDAYKEMSVVKYNKRLLQLLSPTEQAWLKMHETVYRIAMVNKNQSDSQRVRVLVRYLMSKNLDTDSADKLAQTLAKVGFGGYYIREYRLVEGKKALVEGLITRRLNDKGDVGLAYNLLEPVTIRRENQNISIFADTTENEHGDVTRSFISRDTSLSLPNGMKAEANQYVEVYFGDTNNIHQLENYYDNTKIKFKTTQSNPVIDNLGFSAKEINMYHDSSILDSVRLAKEGKISIMPGSEQYVKGMDFTNDGKLLKLFLDNVYANPGKITYKNCEINLSHIEFMYFLPSGEIDIDATNKANVDGAITCVKENNKQSTKATTSSVNSNSNQSKFLEPSRFGNAYPAN